MPSRTIRFGAGVGVATALALASPGSAETGAVDYWPLDAGRQWIYNVHRDLMHVREDRPLTRYFVHGREIQEALDPTRRDGRRVVPVTSALVEQNVAGGEAPSHERTTYFYARDADGFTMSESQLDFSSKPHPDRPSVDQPLRLLRTPLEPKRSWDAGRIRSDDLEIALRAEVLGHEDVVEGEHTFEDCLKVRYRGDLGGVLRIGDERFDVETGQYERIVWLAAGVGLVREITLIEGEFREQVQEDGAFVEPAPPSERVDGEAEGDPATAPPPPPEPKSARTSQVHTRRLIGYYDPDRSSREPSAQ